MSNRQKAEATDLAQLATPKRTAGPRLQHVVARSAITTTDTAGGTVSAPVYDEILVFGQKVDALEHIYQAGPGWAYVAIAHGQSFVDALKAAKS